jgi:hypothetical protein
VKKLGAVAGEMARLILESGQQCAPDVVIVIFSKNIDGKGRTGMGTATTFGVDSEALDEIARKVLGFALRSIDEG